MTERRSKFPILPIIFAGGFFLVGIGFVIVVFLFVFADRDNSASSGPEAIPTLAVQETLFIPTATIQATETPTQTPVPTEPPEPTAEPTDEPTAVPPTNVPATNAPQPTAVPPTDTPVPTNVPASSKLTNVSFSVQNPTVAKDTRIVFDFSITNASVIDPLPFGLLGAVILDASGNNVAFQTSWTGHTMQPGETLNWQDGFSGIGTPGTYTFQLSICYSSVEACTGGSGEWELLASPITVTVQ